MAQLGNDYEFARRIANLEAQVRALATSPILLNASTGQDGGQGLATDKNGLHLFNPAGVEDVTLATADGSANFNGNATFGGSVFINGNLSVPNGSISNAALQSPVNTGSVGGSETNFGVTTGSPVQHAVLTITVPTGYTKATVLCVASASATNSGASGDYLYVSANAGLGGGGETISYAGSGYETSATASAINTFSGLSGGTITVATLVRSSSAAWSASTGNIANTNAIAIFTR